MKMSSFRKRQVHKPVPGTRTSPQTGQVITSSGNPSFDVIVGGGLPVGSICLIEEDKYVTFSKVLAKYFIAEGVVSGQSILLASLDDNPTEIMFKLPKPLNDYELEKEKAEDPEDNENSPKNGLRIAWRYNDLPPVNSEQTPKKIGHHFNLMETLSTDLLGFVDTLLWNREIYRLRVEIGQKTSSYSVGNISARKKDMDIDQERIEAVVTEILASPTKKSATTESQNSTNVCQPEAEQHETRTAAPKLDVDATNQQKSQLPTTSETKDDVPQVFNNANYTRLLQVIQTYAGEEKFALSHHGSSVYRNLCRICITSLGSPLWYDDEFPKHILKFLTVLRGIVRNTVSVCFISMPMHLIAKLDETLVPKIRNLVDYAIELESFAGSERETNPVFKDYNGLLHMHKITAVNTLNAYVPETADLAFKLRRKKFVIEKLHLPPELKESDADENKPTLSCSGGGGQTASSTPLAMDF